MYWEESGGISYAWEVYAENTHYIYHLENLLRGVREIFEWKTLSNIDKDGARSCS